jgi:hypothetical protein
MCSINNATEKKMMQLKKENVNYLMDERPFCDKFSIGNELLRYVSELRSSECVAKRCYTVIDNFDIMGTEFVLKFTEHMGKRVTSDFRRAKLKQIRAKLDKTFYRLLNEQKNKDRDQQKINDLTLEQKILKNTIAQLKWVIKGSHLEKWTIGHTRAFFASVLSKTYALNNPITPNTNKQHRHIFFLYI